MALALTAAELLIIVKETSPDDIIVFLEEVLPSCEEWEKLERHGFINQVVFFSKVLQCLVIRWSAQIFGNASEM